MSLFFAAPLAQRSIARSTNASETRHLASWLLQAFEKVQHLIWDKPRSAMFGLTLGARNFSVGAHPRLKGRRYITVGDNFKALDRLWLETVTSPDIDDPNLQIGSNVTCSDSVHIAATKRVLIGNHVLIGSRVTITDHNHGVYHGIRQSDPEQTPWDRPLTVDAQTVIEDNVWLGDGVVVLAGSHIGRGSVIGANATVTGFIPPYCIAVGSPAKLIRRYDTESKTWRPVDDTPIEPIHS